MLSCDAPDRDNDTLYDAVSADRDPLDVPRLRRLGPTVKEAYVLYGGSTSADVTVSPTSILNDPNGELGDLLRGNWNLLGRVAYREVRSDALRASDGLCSLCGSINAGEVDHYLPQKHFPEFSIFTNNLIAACGRCNRKKLIRHARSGGGMAFIHPYMHGLPNEAYLACEVEVGATVLVTYSVVQTPSMSAALFDVLSNHFSALDLASLYRNEALGLMNEQRNAYYAYYRDSGAEGVANYLSVDERASRARHAFGAVVRRHWKPVLLAALAASNDFCNGGFRALGEEFPLD